MIDTAALNRSTQVIASAQLELEGKGYPPRLVTLGIERAKGAAESKSAPINPAIRGQAFHDLLLYELRGVEQWIIGQQKFLDGQDK